MTPNRLIAALTAAALSLSCLPASAGENWPGWRGPNGNGATDAKNLPTEWDAASGKNIVWKLDLPGKSAATPAVWGGKVFLLSPDGDDVFLWCVALADAKPIWKQKIGGGNKLMGWNKGNNFASSSPSTDGKHVWVLCGGVKGTAGELFCFDMDGKEIWRRNIQKDFGPWSQDFGYGATPLVHGDAVYIPVQHRPESYLLAVDKLTGKDLWRTVRNTHAENESRDAYSSPVVLEYADGKIEIVLSAADLVTAYDSKTGKETWRSDGLNLSRSKAYRIVASPVAGKAMIYAPTAKGGPVLAIKAGGSGDVTTTGRAWTMESDTPDRATPALADGKLYLARESGVVICLDADTGKVLWKNRCGPGGDLKPSPVVADGKVYVHSENGGTVVLAAGAEFKVLATNKLGEADSYASPVIVGDKILIRTGKSLYCIGSK